MYQAMIRAEMADKARADYFNKLTDPNATGSPLNSTQQAYGF